MVIHIVTLTDPIMHMTNRYGDIMIDILIDDAHNLDPH